MKKVCYLVLDMEKRSESPVIGVYEDLSGALEDAIEYGEFTESRDTVWIDHWEDGISVRVLKFNSKTGEYESEFDDQSDAEAAKMMEIYDDDF